MPVLVDTLPPIELEAGGNLRVFLADDGQVIMLGRDAGAVRMTPAEARSLALYLRTLASRSVRPA